MEHRVIYHLPHAAAHQVVILIDLLPVGLGVAGADAHGVGVLAQEVGPVVQLLLLAAVLAHLVHLLHRGVHLRAHVVGHALAVHGALVVHGQL